MSKRLESEVWSLDTCAGCGLCVAACSKQVLKWDGRIIRYRRNTPRPSAIPKSHWIAVRSAQKFCEETCPRLEHWAALEPS